MKFSGISFILLLFVFAAHAQVKLPPKENNTPVKQTPAKTAETKPAVSEPTLVLKVTTDISCKFYIDGEYYATIEADDVKKVSLKKGEYQFKAVSTANPDEVFKKIYSVTKEDVGDEKYYEIDFRNTTTNVSSSQFQSIAVAGNGKDAQVIITWEGPGSVKLFLDKEEYFFTEGQQKTLDLKSDLPYSLKAVKPDKTYAYNDYLGFVKGEQSYTLSITKATLYLKKTASPQEKTAEAEESMRKASIEAEEKIKAEAAEIEKVASEGHRIIVNEVLQTGSYTYLRATEGNKEEWLAVIKTQASVGQTYTYDDATLMTDFTSKELRRTFKEILFISKLK